MWNTVHMILRIIFHPEGCPFAPCKTMENICEHHFSQKKLGNSASPSIAACIYSTHKTHMKQLKNPFEAPPTLTGTGISMEKASEIMQKAFFMASRLESACSVGISAETLRKQLVEWWDEHGLSILLEGRAAPETEELGSDSEDEGDDTEDQDATDAAEPVHLPKPDPVKGIYDEAEIPKQMLEAHALVSMEVVKELKDEIVELQQKDMQAPVPEVELKDPLSPFGGPETEPTGAASANIPNTVGQILTAAGLRQFKPSAEDTEGSCLLRVRSLAGPIRLFVQKVRLHDKVLSRAQICGKVGKHCGRHHQLEHALARLRRKYSLNGVRQSRFAAWAFFSRQVATTANEKGTAASEIQQFVPSCSTRPDGSRRYQILVIRTHILGKPQFCLVEEVIRGSLNKKGRRTGKKLSEMPVDAHMVASIRGVLLEPVAAKNQDNMLRFRCTCRSPSGIFHLSDEDGTLLWVVPGDLFTVEETKISLELLIHDTAFQALKTCEGTVPDFKTKAESQTAVVSYTFEAFRQKKNIMGYVDVMKRMLLKNFGKKIASDEGMLLGSAKSLKWADLLLAVPRWFQKFGPASAGDLPSKVHTHYRSIAPTPDRGPQKFVNWIKEVAEMMESPLPLDTE